MDRKIKVKLDSDILSQTCKDFEISGWYSGDRTYLWLGTDRRCFATLSGQELYKLAKKIVKEFEKGK